MNPKNPLVSILTLTYNHRKFIGDCIESVQSQTYSNWEMIIVDDGSTDDTSEIISSYAQNDSRIKLITRENIGVFRMKENYNLALSHSTGKYIAILDGDDVWTEDKLEIQVPLLEKNDDSVVCFGQAYRSSIDLTKNTCLSPQKDMPVFRNNYQKSIDLSYQLILGNIAPALTLVIRRSALNEIGGFQQRKNLPLVDLPTLLELSLIGKFIFVPKPLGKWRHHGNEVTLIHSLSIAEGLYEFSLDFYKRNKDNPKFSTLTEKIIYKSHHNNYVMRYSRSGRKKLSLKDYSGARQDYMISIFKFGFSQPVWKLRSIVGIVFAIFHWDLEKFIRLLGKQSYQ